MSIKVLTKIAVQGDVYVSNRVSCLAPLNRAQMPGGYRDIT